MISKYHNFFLNTTYLRRKCFLIDIVKETTESKIRLNKLMNNYDI